MTDPTRADVRSDGGSPVTSKTSKTSKTSTRPPGTAKVNPAVVLMLCSGATFMAFLDLSVVNIAFPDILADYPSTPIPTLTWIASGYAITFAAFLTPAGRVADTAGRHKTFLIALAGFTLASLVCAAAPNPGVIIAGRVLQGMMAAGMIPSALALIISSTPVGGLLKAIGTWTAVSGFSAVVGPVVGGVLVEQFGWRSVFFINIPVGLGLVLAGARALPRHQPPVGGRLPDLVGTLMLTTGIAGAVAGLTEGDRWGWTSAPTLGLLVGGVVLGVLALLRSRGHVAPAIEIQLWRSRRFAWCNIVYALFGAPMFAWLLSGALFTTQVWRWSIMQSAGALSVGAVVSMVTAIITGRITDQTKHRPVIALGAILFAACCGLMATNLFDTEPRFWTAWVPAAILGGGGIGFAVTGLGAVAATALPPLQFAAGVGMNMTARQVGGALGIAGLAAIMSAGSGPLLGAFHHLYLACAVGSALAAFAILWLPDPSPASASQPEAAVTR